MIWYAGEYSAKIPSGEIKSPEVVLELKVRIEAYGD